MCKHTEKTQHGQRMSEEYKPGLVSVIIPTYNRAHLISRAIKSVLNQTYQDFEIIIIDDGSEDGSAGVVKIIDDNRIKLICQENRGVSAARNRGIEEAKADLIAFLDADDEWRPRFLETVLRLRDRYPEAGAYATAYEIHERNGDMYIPKYKHIPLAPWEGIIPNYFKMALGPFIVCTSAIAIPRNVFADVGKFVLQKGLGQDQDLWARIALKYPVAFSWQIGAVYHREVDRRRCSTIFTHVPIWNSLEKMASQTTVPEDVLPYLHEFLAKKKIMAASRYVLGGQTQLARSILKDCKTKYFLTRKLWWSFWSLMPTWITSCAWYVKRKLFGRAG